MQKLGSINSHLEPKTSFNLGSVPQKSDEDIVLVGMARTALTKAKRGGFKDTPTETMLTAVLKDVIAKSGVDPKHINELVIGNVLQPGSGVSTARIAQFLSGITETCTLQTINRMCSSGLQAVATVANAIRAGEYEVGIGGGFESMSLYDMNALINPELLSEAVFEHELARNSMMPMGITSENVAEKFGISREQQDAMAAESHRKAAVAMKNGWLQSEITPVHTFVKDKEGNEKQVVIKEDEGVRESTTAAGLGKLKAAFKKGGTTTAGNSSQVTDGAAVVMLMKRSTAKKLGAPIKGRILSFSVAGVPPEIMGIGPAFAIPKALEKAGLGINDIDIFEVNEAFASQATYCVKKLGIPEDKLNPRGGALALGHPLGMTGARMICTLFSELERTNKKRGVVSMCIGTGMGACGIFERD